MEINYRERLRPDRNNVSSFLRIFERQSIIVPRDDSDNELLEDGEAEVEVPVAFENENFDPSSVVVTEADEISDENVEPSEQPQAPYRWRHREPPVIDTKFEKEFDVPDEVGTPYQYFKQFFDSELMSKIADETNIYSYQKGHSESSIVNVTPHEIEQYIGILLKMALIQMPRYRMYWSASTKCSAVTDVMSVNRFDQIKRSIHFNNNLEMPKRGEPNYDKLYKVRPLVDSVTEKCNRLEQEEHQSLDETIIPTKVKSSLKQYVPNKPHKWGIKVFTRAGSSGLVYHIEIYQGQTSNTDGKVENVIRRMSSGIPNDLNHKLFMDNWFTTLSMMITLKERGIFVTGTIRSNRLKGGEKLLKTNKELQNQERGSMDSIVDANSGISLIKWLDNGVVCVATSHIGTKCHDTVRRWSNKQKEHMEINIPEAIKQYNLHMGGVDLSDMLLSLYRIKVSNHSYRLIYF